MKKTKSKMKGSKTTDVIPADMDLVNSRLTELSRLAELKKLKKSLDETKSHHAPNMFQLAQLAAQLARREDFQDQKKTDELVEMALTLWGSCAVLLWNKTFDIISVLQGTDYCGDEKVYPMPFENALKIIVRKKNRLSDRHKAFRDFLRDVYRERVENEVALQSAVEKTFAIYKQDGFSKDLFCGVLKLYLEWLGIRHKAKAQNAASIRWKKKDQKNPFLDSDFSKTAASIFPLPP